MHVPVTDQEVVDELRSSSPLNKARKVFSSWSAKIEHASIHSTPIDPIEWRRMEFQAVAEIAGALGLKP